LKLLKEQQVKIGVPEKSTKINDSKRILKSAIHYVEENKERMDYPSARMKGLPISSCRVESLIKQVNQRVKASDKFWVIPKLEAVLQLRAAELSTTKKWDSFWEKRSAFLKENMRVFMSQAA
jgi:hypothetical protein